MIAFSGRALLLDIEGTTTSIGYVYDVLFPFVRNELAAFLETHWDDGDVARAKEFVAKDAGAATFQSWAGTDTAIAREKLQRELIRLMDGDVKATGLKEFQGLVWRRGYEAGKLKSHVYADVPTALEKWHRSGLDVRIYSSGSIAAQRVFFANTEHGDLGRFIKGNYDTTTGPKREPASYSAIAADMRLPAQEIVFLSDVVAELDAARATGMSTVLCVRPGNANVPPGHRHPRIESFAELAIAATRQ